MVASVPPSVAAFHLAMGPDGDLYVSGPTLTARDHVYRVSLDGKVEVAWSDFGRPQGLAFGPDGALYIVEALSGASGLYRVELESSAPPQLVLSGAGPGRSGVRSAGGRGGRQQRHRLAAGPVDD